MFKVAKEILLILKSAFCSAQQHLGFVKYSSAENSISAEQGSEGIVLICYDVTTKAWCLQTALISTNVIKAVSTLSYYFLLSILAYLVLLVKRSSRSQNNIVLDQFWFQADFFCVLAARKRNAHAHRLYY